MSYLELAKEVLKRLEAGQGSLVIDWPNLPRLSLTGYGLKKAWADWWRRIEEQLKG